MRTRLAVVALWMVLLTPSARAAVTSVPWLVPPVGGPVVAAFDEPSRRWGPGHRGIDIGATAGTVVGAAADGTVSFAGRVGPMQAVTVDHGGGVETTYSDLGSIAVNVGERVTEGTILGTVARPHDGLAPGLHFGVKQDGRYLDPQPLLLALDTSVAIHLAPLMWQPPQEMGESFAGAFREAGTAYADCRPPEPVGEGVAAPNANVAVAVAGIGSSSADASIYREGPEQLGYRTVYRFSYAGVDGDDAHVPYGPDETFDDIYVAAGKLRALLAEIGRRHPGRHVDLLAHSQGGIVARTLLAGAARTSDTDVPPIDHLVTFASPHEGAALAGQTAELSGNPLGRALLRAARRAATALHLPDPSSEAVRQLAPGSDLLRRLDSETLLYGTRALTLAIPNDVVVPASAALLDGATTDVVPPAGWWGHDAIVSSRAALATAYQFLRGGPPPCRDGWDRWGTRIGAGIERIEGALDDLPTTLLRRGF